MAAADNRKLYLKTENRRQEGAGANTSDEESSDEEQESDQPEIQRDPSLPPRDPLEVSKPSKILIEQTAK